MTVERPCTDTRKLRGPTGGFARPGRKRHEEVRHSDRTERQARVFQLFLIKPSHYDDDGYVIQWIRSSIPANTLATLNGLALDCAERRVLGADVEIRITV